MGGRSAKDIIAAARRPERTYALCLRGDLQSQWETLERQLNDLLRSSAGSLEGDDRVRLADEMKQLEDEMEAATLTLTLRALHRNAYQSLLAAHPPRRPPETSDDDAAEVDEVARAAAQRDQQQGYNVDTFYTALIHASIVAPDLDDGDFDAMLDAITDRQFDELAGLALLLNRGEVSVPFSPTASRLTRDSATS